MLLIPHALYLGSMTYCQSPTNSSPSPSRAIDLLGFISDKFFVLDWVVGTLDIGYWVLALGYWLEWLLSTKKREKKAVKSETIPNEGQFEYASVAYCR